MIYSCATDPGTLRRYILPFYYALTEPFATWPKWFTKAYFNELDGGAQARAEKTAKEGAQQKASGSFSSVLTPHTNNWTLRLCYSKSM